MNKSFVLPLGAAVVLLALGTAGTAAAKEKIYKYDQFSDDPTIAKGEIESVKVNCQPGFAQSEAYGILIEPDPADYPFDIIRVEFLQGDTLNDPNSDKQNVVTVQVYNDDSTDPAPKGAPIFEISSNDIVDPLTVMPQHVQEGVFMQYKFDPLGDPMSHPKKITAGNIRVMLQFDDLDEFYPSIPGCEGLSGFGCQDPCALADEAGMGGGSLIRTVTKDWYFNEAVGVKGDWILRVVLDVPDNSSSSSSSSSGSGSSSSGGAGGSGSGCNSDADCPEATQVCRSHMCVEAAECKSDAECPSVDQVCRANKCQATDTGCGCEMIDRAPGGSVALMLLAGASAIARRARRKSPRRSE